MLSSQSLGTLSTTSSLHCFAGFSWLPLSSVFSLASRISPLSAYLLGFEWEIPSIGSCIWELDPQLVAPFREIIQLWGGYGILLEKYLSKSVHESLYPAPLLIVFLCFLKVYQDVVSYFSVSAISHHASPNISQIIPFISCF